MNSRLISSQAPSKVGQVNAYCLLFSEFFRYKTNKRKSGERQVNRQDTYRINPPNPPIPKWFSLCIIHIPNREVKDELRSLIDRRVYSGGMCISVDLISHKIQHLHQQSTCEVVWLSLNQYYQVHGRGEMKTLQEKSHISNNGYRVVSPPVLVRNVALSTSFIPSFSLSPLANQCAGDKESFYSRDLWHCVH